MPSPAEERAYTVEDFADFLAALSEEGFDFVVIGGCAVGTYAHLERETLVSQDIDLYTTRETLEEILDWLPRHGGRVLRRPPPRAYPEAVVEWNGKEINLLTERDGLPDPADALRLSREFRLKRFGGLKVLLADPYDLLANQLRLGRQKDEAHCELLLHFITDEVVAAFCSENSPRKRLEPARRLLRVNQSATLPDSLAERLISAARRPPDFRFLANHVPRREQLEKILQQAESDAELTEQLREIAKRRRFE